MNPTMFDDYKDDYKDDPELLKMLNEWEEEEAEKRDDPELNVTWEYLMVLPNWLNWLGIAREKDSLIYEAWSDLSCCFGCKHLNEKNIWCKLQNIPATINPILTLRTGMVGMACMGMGREVWIQLGILPPTYASVKAIHL